MKARTSAGVLAGMTILATILIPKAVLAERAKEWWPERAAFQSCGGAFREALSPDGCYVYDPEHATAFFGSPNGHLSPGAQIVQTYEDGLKFLPWYPGYFSGLVGWNLGNIKPGTYWLSLQACSGDEARPHAAESIHYLVRVNGTMVDLSTMDAPAYVGKGAFASEMQSAAAVSLKPGDRITVSSGGLNSPFVGKLRLWPRAPGRGPIIRNPMFLPTFQLEPVTETWRAGHYVRSTAEGTATVSYWLENRANGPQTVQLDFAVTDYYGCPVLNHPAKHELKDAQRVEGKFDFPLGGAPRYLVTMTGPGADGRPLAKHASIRSEVLTGRHLRAWLRTSWQQARIPGVIKTGDAPPPDAKWEPYPGGALQMGAEYMADKAHRHTHVAWLKAPFQIPGWMKEKRVILHFEGLGDEAAVYVNGKRVGECLGSKAPCSFDITELAKRDQPNELLLGIRDWIAHIDQKALEAHGPEWNTDPRGLVVVPGGGFINSQPSAGISGAVFLENCPVVAVSDVYADCSVRGKNLGVELTVTNAGQAEREAIVAPVVKDAGQAVLSLPERKVTVKAGESLPLRIDAPFENPHLWSIDDPHLYELAVTLRDPKDNQPLEEHRSRFGFREFTVSDGLYLMNGEPAKLFFNIPLKEEGGSIRRSQATKDELDQADETGWMLKFEGLPGVCWPNDFTLSSDLFWRNAEILARRIVLAYRNHPSIAIWDPSNEYACFCRTVGTAEGGGGMELANQRLCKLGEVIQAIDPVRPVEFDSDGDLGGRWNTLSLHYPRDTAPLEANSNLYVPDGYLFRPMNHILKPGEEYSLGLLWPIPAKFREKPVMASEIGQFSIGVAHDVTIIGGDEPYVSQPAADRIWQSRLDRYILDGLRDIEAAHYHSWTHPVAYGTTKIIIPPRYVVALDYMGHWCAGETVAFQTNIHHDMLKTEPMKVQWALLDANGVRALSGVLADRPFKSAEMVRTQISFTAPKVKAETGYRFLLEVLHEGKVVFSRDDPIVVYPKKQAKPRLSAAFGLYDPEGKSSEALALLGVRAKPITLLEDNPLRKVQVLLIGRDALSEDVAKKAAQPIQDFVRNGGRVVVFEHNRPVRWSAWLPYRLTADTGHTASFAFPRAADHPVLKGIALEDLRLWRDDRVVSRHDYLKPERGSFLSLVDSGGRRGLEWTPLLEVYFGKGSYVLCQLCLTEKAALDPCAAKLLANLLRYVDGQPNRQLHRVAVLAEAKSPLATFVDRLKTDVRILPPANIAELSVLPENLLVDASADLSEEQAQAALNVAKLEGGKVVLHGLTDKTVATWSKGIGARGELRAVSPYYLGRAIRRDWHPLLAGLSMHEFHWHKRVGGDGHSFEDWARLAELSKTEIVISAPGARTCTYPAVFVSVPYGDGEVIFDQIQWDTAGEVVGPFCRRIASTLLTHLGAQFEPMPPSRTVEKPLAYLPIDLSPFVNRPMADDKADDKEGGWSDQGPQIDGRQFPTGRVMVKGIAFLIGGEKERDPHDKTAIILNATPFMAAARFREQLSEVKGIPVNRKLETLHFLHTGAWTWPEHLFSYFVNYEDGTKEDIRVVGGINTTDWWINGQLPTFPDEMPGVTTQVGLIAENPTFEAIGAFLMEWVNPWPQKAVTTVDIIYCTRSPCTPVIMGITAGIKATAETPAEIAPKGDRAKAETLVKSAESLIKAGKYADAETMLKDAAAADPGYGRAHFLLGRVCRDTKREKEAVKHYRAAAGIIPDSTEILNELAGLLEAQGKKLQSLLAYQQSLEVNWNQPPVLEAIARLNRLK